MCLKRMVGDNGLEPLISYHMPELFRWHELILSSVASVSKVTVGFLHIKERFSNRGFHESTRDNNSEDVPCQKFLFPTAPLIALVPSAILTL